MARTLNEKEKQVYINNRNELHNQLSELQADFEDLADDELIDCRATILERINKCMVLVLEIEDDNL